MPRYRKKNKNAKNRSKKESNSCNTNNSTQLKGHDDGEVEEDGQQQQQQQQNEVENNVNDDSLKLEINEEVKDCLPSSSIAIDVVLSEDDNCTEINATDYNDIKIQQNADNNHEKEIEVEGGSSSDAETLKANSESPEKEISFGSISDLDRNEYNVLYPESENSSSFNQNSPPCGANDDDLTIQEMSDSNSFDDAETPPVVSEADSEADKDSLETQKSVCEILCENTLGVDWEEALTAEINQHKANEKSRRAQKRSELETHFLPQLLNPRYLDSITEENSDASDMERKSDKSETDQIPSSPSGSNIKSNVLDEAIAKKATAVFPKSNLDFSKKRKHSPGLLSSKKREETTPSIVEAKIVEQESIEESCSTWNTDVTPESETAELVFINSVSASSSTSDLMDSSASIYSESSETSNAESDLSTDNLELELDNEIINIQLQSKSSTAEQQSKNQRISSKSPPPLPLPQPQPLLSSSLLLSSSKSTPPVDIIQRNEEEIVIPLNNDIKIKNDQTDFNIHPNADGISEISSEKFCVSSQNEALAISTHTEMNENSKINIANSISRDQQLVQGCGQNSNIKNENEEILLNDNNTRNSSTEKILEKSSSNGKIYREIDRQESLDSYCSEDSHSTSHSQCTAISCGSFTEFRGSSEPPSENQKTESLQQRISPQRQQSISSSQSKVVPLKELSREAVIKMPYGGLVIEKLFKSEESNYKYTSTMSNKDPELIHRHNNTGNVHNYELSTAKRQQNLENFVQKSRNSASPPPIPPKSYMNYFPSDSDDQQTTDSNSSDQHKNRLLAIIHKTNESKEESLNHTQKVLPNVEDKIIKTTALPPQPPPPPPPQTVPSTPLRLSSLTEAKVKETTQQPTFASTNHIDDIKRFSHPDFTKDYFQHLPDQDMFHSSAKKRFSNIETSSNSDHYCSQIKQTAPVKHSSFESSTTESIKKIENGKVITDVTNCNKQSESYSENALNANSKIDKISDNATTGTGQVHEVMSDVNLKQTTADQIRPIEKCLDKQQNHRHVEQHHIIDENNSSIYRKTAEKQNETFSKISSNDFTYDEFRQRAKELSTKKKTENELFDYDKVLKEFDQLSKLLKQELDSRPSMTASDKRKNTECYQSQSQDESSCKRQEKMSQIMRNLTEMKSKVIENKNMQQSSSYFGSHDNFKRFSTLPLEEKFNDSNFTENQKRFSVNIPMTIPVSNNDSTPIFNQNTQKQETAPKKEYQIPITKETVENKEQPIQRESLFSNLHQKHEQESTKSFTSSSKIQLEKTVDSQKEYRIPIAIDPSFAKQKHPVADHPLRQRSVSQPREYQIPVQVIQTPPTAYHSSTVPNRKSQSNLFRQASTGVEYFIPVEIDTSPIPKHATYEIPMQITHHFATSKPKPPPVPPMFDFSEQTAHNEKSSREHHIPMLIESSGPLKANTTIGMEIPQRFESQVKAMAAARDEFFSHFASKCQPKTMQSFPSPPASSAPYQNATQENTATRSNEDSCSTSLDDHSSSRSYQYYHSSENLNDRYSSERQFSQPNYEELGASSENIAKPFRREVEICMRGKRPNVKAPRLTVSTNDLSTSPRSYENYYTHTQPRTPPRHHPFMFLNRSAHPKLAPLSEETSDHRIKHVSFSQPTEQFHSESPPIQQMQQLPLGDDIEFRQKMAQEWLSKVAEREERRQQKIIKISKVEENFGSYGSSSRKPLAIDIGDEFIRKVKERRSKLCMTSDSELESGPESISKGSKSESDESNVKVIEGQSVADLKRLPKHIRDFARLTSQIIKSHQEEAAAAGMSSCDASKINTTTDSTTDDAESQQSPMFSPKFKAKAPHGSGIWSPNQQESSQTYVTTDINENRLAQSNQTDTTSATDRPEFRPVKFDSPVLPRRYVRNDTNAAVQPPWTYNDFRPSCKASSCTNLNQDQCVNSIGTNQFSSTSNIAHKIQSFEQIDKSSSNTNINRVGWSKKETRPLVKPNEIIYSLKNEYYSEPESDSDHPKKMAQLGRRKFEGIGPTTKDGMPIVLRSEVKEPRQHEWYKKIFQTLHKTKDDDDYVTVRYKSPRGRYPYKEKSNGYMSEPEKVYDSDYYSTMYSLDRRRIPAAPRTVSIGRDERDYGTVPNPVRSGIGSYKIQPGKIENYAPGHSSLSEKEKVTQRDIQKLSQHYTEGNLSRALKEQGYESDSNLIFRKKEESLYSEINPNEQRQSYKNLQSGGEPPLLGFRKPAPEKLKAHYDDIEIFPISSTLHKIQVYNKNAIPQPQREIACYPNLKLASSHMDVTTHITKHQGATKSSPLPAKGNRSKTPPAPPNRSSLKVNSVRSTLAVDDSKTRSHSPRHEACFKTDQSAEPVNKYGTITLRKHSKREPIIRSKSATLCTSSKLLSCLKDKTNKDTNVYVRHHSVRMNSVSPHRPSSRIATLRKTSPVAFGRSISKERTFAEEKKRLEETLPLTRSSFTASTNILRDPNLKSPDEVKKAVRNYAIPLRRCKSSPRSGIPTGMSLSFNITETKKLLRSPIKHSSSSTTVRSDLQKKSLGSQPKLSTLPNKSTARPKHSIRTSSTYSLAQTNSTFSIDSCDTKTKISIKKPEIITRSSRRGKASPVCGSKSESNIKNAIQRQKDSIQRDQFFQNLFQRDASPSNQDEEIMPTTSIQEKTKFFNSMSLKSDPPLHRSSSYLSHTKPVQNSKFHLYDQKTYHKSRSLSPSYRRQPGYNVLEKLSKLQSFTRQSDEESEFCDDLLWQYEHRSLSEPRHKMVESPNPPSTQEQNEKRKFSPTREIRVPQNQEIRSPSRRRIESFRESQKGDTKKIIRASSLSSADDRAKNSLYQCDHLSHSASSLNYFERHSPACRFRNSERFIDLNRFYSTLERVGQLEAETSATDSKPIRREEELIDYDEWRKVRTHERAEKELHYLVGKLKQDQKDKDFLFRPKDVEDVKWNEFTDYGLRSKDKSVEDLRESFERKILEENSEDCRARLQMDEMRDTYKPFWRGSSVSDFAANMEVKYNADNKSFGVQKSSKSSKPICLSNRLISTLSKDQVFQIRKQLNEIYSASALDSKHKCEEMSEDYVITVKEQPKDQNALKVRSNSTISKEELLGPVLRKKQAQYKSLKWDSMPEIQAVEQSSSFEKTTQKIVEPSKESGGSELTSVDKCMERKSRRSTTPVMLGRETRGAIAAENAKRTLPDIPPPPPLPPKHLTMRIRESSIETYRKNSEQQNEDEYQRHEILQEDHGEYKSVELPISNSAVVKDKPNDSVQQKIQYFEEKKEEKPPKTIYHAREYSSPDEDEIMRVIDEKRKARDSDEASTSLSKANFRHAALSSSASDLKELFGEKRTNFQFVRPPPAPNKSDYSEAINIKVRQPIEENQTNKRSNSASPTLNRFSYLHKVQTGEVQKIKNQLESLGKPKCPLTAEKRSLKKMPSDSELNKTTKSTKETTTKLDLKSSKKPDVSRLTHSFERKSRSESLRDRSRSRKVCSPIPRSPLRKEDRLMPHIDIISKTASLKHEMSKSHSPSPTRHQSFVNTGNVNRIRTKFEKHMERSSLMGKLYTSNPDISDLRDISDFLSGIWTAHMFPKRQDNSRPLHSPEIGPASQYVRRRIHLRTSSASPPRKMPRTPSVVSKNDFFANQNFDPLKHRPKSRYVPTDTDTKQNESEEAPPRPPLSQVIYDANGFDYQESPSRYIESDVNIHYKTPIRYEPKEIIAEEELARRQAESMRKLYEEERRQKYLKELQDINSRRHTDNFTPSQKSPIALNRYDDFVCDLAPKSPNISKTIARALFNFQGQTARELSFKKGDMILIRRQIDDNWYEGEYNAMLGLFPVSYVEVISRDHIKRLPKRPSEGQARAKFNFQAQSGIELSLNKGELVTLTRRVDKNWFEGKIANRKGIFPVSYVEVLTDIGAEDLASTTTTTTTTHTKAIVPTKQPSLETLRTNINNELNSLTNRNPSGILRETKTIQKTKVLHVDTNTEPLSYRALYKYRPQNNDELELMEGDLIYVIEKCDDGWYVGSSQRTGCFGTFPGNYVELI